MLLLNPGNIVVMDNLPAHGRSSTPDHLGRRELHFPHCNPMQATLAKFKENVVA